jgi:hypothetical protein
MRGMGGFLEEMCWTRTGLKNLFGVWPYWMGAAEAGESRHTINIRLLRLITLLYKRASQDGTHI